MASLKRHQAYQKARMMGRREIWQATDPAFDRGDGVMLHPNTLDGAFHREATRLWLPRIRLHDLRHTSATLAPAKGIHPAVVSGRLGHNSISMTLDRYSYVSMSMRQAAADRLDAALGG